MQTHTQVETIISTGQVRTVFQPIVNLNSGMVCGYEALSRGPAGPLEGPDNLLSAARACGRLAELDFLCIETALRSATAGGLHAPLTLFLNVEPEVLDAKALLGQVAKYRASSTRPVEIVLEITERELSARPIHVLAEVRILREAGWRIALDDVGADDLSLALMPLLQPDIIKLDLRLVQSRPTSAVAHIMSAVNAYSELTGAMILAEGIETQEHLAAAQALGATLGQGWLFGRPTPQARCDLSIAPLVLRSSPAPVWHGSAFQCLPPSTTLRISTKDLLVKVSKNLEQEAARLGSSCLLIGCFEASDKITTDTARRYRELATQVGFVAVIASTFDEPMEGVHLLDATAKDPTNQGEWTAVVLSPHFSGALLARSNPGQQPQEQRTFQFTVTYNRKTVTEAAQTLLTRSRIR